MKTHECWKCKEHLESHQGRTSEKGNFTCFICLRAWNDAMKPIWKRDAENFKKIQNKTPLGQLDIFSLHETLNSVFS